MDFSIPNLTTNKNVKKKEETKKSAGPVDVTKRSYTVGSQLPARQMFVFNEDGTIAGLVDKPIDQPSNGGNNKHKKSI